MLYQLRSADTDDVPAIRETYLGSWRAGYSGLLPAATLDDQAEIRKSYDWLARLEDRSAFVVVAVADEALVGVVLVADDAVATPHQIHSKVPPSSNGSFRLIYYCRRVR